MKSEFSKVHNPFPYSNKFALISNHNFKGSGVWLLGKALKWRVITPNKLPKADLDPAVTVVNWGSSRFPQWANSAADIVNHPETVLKAINKRIALETLESNSIPHVRFTTNKEKAKSFLQEKRAIFCRTKLTGHSGDGIVIADKIEDLVNAPLYTINFPKTHEYRIHVFQKRIIDIAQKKSMGDTKLQESGLSKVDRRIRNRANGWVYAKDDLLYDQALSKLAINAIEALGLDFGAVDILAIWDNKHNRKLINHAVCEINTAPGLAAPSTFKAYMKAFHSLQV